LRQGLVEHVRGFRGARILHQNACVRGGHSVNRP
jgi:hypothetical protein